MASAPEEQTLHDFVAEALVAIREVKETDETLFGVEQALGEALRRDKASDEIWVALAVAQEACRRAEARRGLGSCEESMGAPS